MKIHAHEHTKPKDTQAEPRREKLEAKVMLLTAPNEQFCKITISITFQENGKVGFNNSRQSKPSTPQKTNKQNSEFNYSKQRFIEIDRFCNIPRK